MTSWALRPASRARNAPAVWIPSWELPASRMTASWIFSGRRSARSEGGAPAMAVASDFCTVVASGLIGSPMGFSRFYAVLTVTLNNQLSTLNCAGESKQGAGRESRKAKRGRRKAEGERRKAEGERRKAKGETRNAELKIRSDRSEVTDQR